jgi:hypothetical protein
MYPLPKGRPIAGSPCLRGLGEGLAICPPKTLHVSKPEGREAKAEKKKMVVVMMMMMMMMMI